MQNRLNPGRLRLPHTSRQGDRRRIVVRLNAERQPAGYRWEDRNGEWMEYDYKGRLTSYGDSRSVGVKLVRDLNGEGEIVEIRDERNRLLVTLAYEVIPLGERTVYDRSERRLKLLTDYRGRSVVYHYDVADGGKLNAVSLRIGPKPDAPPKGKGKKKKKED